MKVLKIIFFVVIAVIVIGGIAIFIFLKTFDIERFRPQIIAGANEALGRDVDFKDMSFNMSFKEGLNFKINQLAISEDPDFQEGDFLKAESISLGVDIISFLTKRQILISNIQVQSPKVALIRAKDGRINVQTLGKITSKDKDKTLDSKQPESSHGQDKSKANVSKAAFSLPLIFAETIEVKDGIVVYIDKYSTPEVVLEISQFGLLINRFSLTAPFSIKAEGSIFSDEKNFSLGGKALVDIKTNQVKLNDWKIVTDLAKLSLKSVRESLPILKDSSFPDSLRGKVDLTLKELAIDSETSFTLSLDGELSGGAVNFEEIVPGISLEASRIALKIIDFSLKDPFRFSLQAAYLSEQPDVFVEGGVVLDINSKSVQLRGVEVSTDLSLISLSKLQSSFKALQPVELPEKLEGKFVANIAQINVSDKGISSLLFNGELTNGLIKFKHMVSPLGSIYSRVKGTESKLDVEELSLVVGEGNLKAVAAVDDYLGSPNYSLSVDIKNIDLGEVIAQSKQPVKIKGPLSGNFNVKSQGKIPSDIIESLSGEGNLEIKDGMLTDINILQVILDKISIIPGLVDRVKATLPERYKKKLTQKDTILTKLKVKTIIQDEVSSIEPVEIEADGFILSGVGNVSFDQSFLINGGLFIPEDLSASMIESVPELGYLLNEER